MIKKPQPKYGFAAHRNDGHAFVNDIGFQNYLLTHEVEQLKQHIRCLNEIIDELAAELPKDLVLKYTIQPWEKDKSFKPPITLNDLVAVLREHLVVADTVTTTNTGVHRVPNQLKGRPERVSDEHFLDLI